MPFVTTGRTATIVWTAGGLALLAWLLRPVVSGLGQQAYLHHATLDSGQVLAFVLVPATLIVLLVAVRCLNRVLLHAVAWCTAGALANLGELVATGSVADYIFVADRVWSPGDVYLSVGISLLAVGMLRVIYDGATRPAPTCSSARPTDDAEQSQAMFEQFTERARQAVILAHEEARSLKHNYIGTEHMLLGLLREKDGEAARVLETLDITVERVRAHVLRLVGTGEEVIPAQIPFTPRAKRLLELALSFARAKGSPRGSYRTSMRIPRRSASRSYARLRTQARPLMGPLARRRLQPARCTRSTNRTSNAEERRSSARPARFAACALVFGAQRVPGFVPQITGLGVGSTAAAVPVAVRRRDVRPGAFGLEQVAAPLVADVDVRARRR